MPATRTRHEKDQAGNPRSFPLLLIAVGLSVYLNSLLVPFILDDHYAILENPRIQQLWPLWRAMAPAPRATVAWRPIVSLSFAINYAISGLNVWSYHAVNLAIHLLAALVLFGIVRRTLCSGRLASRYGNVAAEVALAVATMWAVHPLQTQSVTYIIQRAESFMGLWYLLTLYSAIRSVETPAHRRRWSVLAILSCAMGMATKPVMVTAPLLVWLYDRTFLAKSFRQAFGQRRGLYVGLLSTWLILAWLLAHAPNPAKAHAGFSFKGITPIEYLQTQPGVLLHYLKLITWPHPLCFDYAWPVAKTPAAIWLPVLIIGALILATLLALQKRPELGFVGAWYFLILAPTSSVIPIADLAVEHRLYLPLAAPIILIVFGGLGLLRWLVSSARLRRKLAMAGLAVCLGILGGLTILRNRDYRSEEAIWRDTLAKRPKNPRAYDNLSVALEAKGQLREAIEHYVEALRFTPDSATLHNNLGVALDQQGHPDEAKLEYLEALRCDPEDASAHNNLGAVLIREGKKSEAIDEFLKALQLDPEHPEAHANLEHALSLQHAAQGRP